MGHYSWLYEKHTCEVCKKERKNKAIKDLISTYVKDGFPRIEINMTNGKGFVIDTEKDEINIDKEHIEINGKGYTTNISYADVFEVAI